MSLFTPTLDAAGTQGHTKTVLRVDIVSSMLSAFVDLRVLFVPSVSAVVSQYSEFVNVDEDFSGSYVAARFCTRV